MARRPYSQADPISRGGRAHALGDFNDMFAFHGLQLQEVYGDIQFGPYDVNNTPRLLMVAKKKTTVG